MLPLNDSSLGHRLFLLRTEYTANSLSRVGTRPTDMSGGRREMGTDGRREVANRLGRIDEWCTLHTQHAMRCFEPGPSFCSLLDVLVICRILRQVVPLYEWFSTPRMQVNSDAAVVPSVAVLGPTAEPRSRSTPQRILMVRPRATAMKRITDRPFITVVRPRTGLLGAAQIYVP